MANNLIEKLKSHIHWEEGMDDSMLSTYLEWGKRYSNIAVGRVVESIVIYAASIYYEYRAPDWQMKEAFDAITPFIVQEVYADGTEELPEQTNE